MNKLKITDDFEEIVINDIPLIDVRAPIEYEKGAFINSINLPILTNDERHIIGICYKEKGNEEATKLGHEIVSGKVKEDRVNGWKKFIEKNPNAHIYCFRGGSRSTIAQRWIYEELGIEIPKLEGGYKAFRNYLIESLEPEKVKAKPLIITGYTGSGKTILLNKLENSVDLEGIANHRGSTFGHYVTPQPTQINFENNLAYNIIKHNNKEYKYMILEDEGRNIGRSFVPTNLYNHFHNSSLIFLDATLEERVSNILTDYVTDAQKQYIDFYGDIECGLNKWYENMEGSMTRVKGKLGGDRFNLVLEEFKKAYTLQISGQGYDYHRNWIELFLKNYYDPMYKHSIEKGNRQIEFRGNQKEIIEYVAQIERK